MGPIWNPWHGCRKYSEGCEHCYMYYLDAARGKNGADIYRVKTSFDLPVARKRDGSFHIPGGEELMVCMTSDFFLEDADAWRDEAWDMIRRRPDVTFWLQTKRIWNVESRLPPDFGRGWYNVKLCVTAENQARADERVPELLRLPFRWKAVMCAPILSEIDLTPYLATGEIRQVLVDGENYDGARPCHYEWVESLYHQCARYGADFSFVGTGNVFIRDGKEYRICKAYQQVQALRSGLQIPPVDRQIPIRKKCATCPRRDACNGCRDACNGSRECGRCR